MSKSSWRSLRQASETETRKINRNINESTKNDFSLDQNFIKVLKSQKSESTEDPLDENIDLFVKTNWNHSNQLRERTRVEKRATPRSFESMRVLKSSWTRWQTRQNSSENSNDKPVKISSSQSPIFEGFATSKPLWSASMKINRGKRVDYVDTNSLMYPIARIIKINMPRTSKLEEMNFELKEGHSGRDDTTRTEVKPAAETSDKKMQNTQEGFSDAMKDSSRSARYRLPPRGILEWLKDNQRVQDMLKLLEKSEKGNFSYDEFVQEMKNMGAPASQEELYDMASALDTNQDKGINYQEVRKLRFRASSIVRNNEFLNQRNGTLPELRPCSKCDIGLFEPTRLRIHRFICLRLKNYVIGRGTQKNTFIGQFTFDVEPDISIYGIQRMVKAELGGSAIGVKILRSNQGVEILNHMKTLEDYGYTGSTDRDQPEMVELLYDYDYPRLDCPLLLANMSR